MVLHLSFVVGVAVLLCYVCYVYCSVISFMYVLRSLVFVLVLC